MAFLAVWSAWSAKSPQEAGFGADFGHQESNFFDNFSARHETQQIEPRFPFEKQATPCEAEAQEAPEFPCAAQSPMTNSTEFLDGRGPERGAALVHAAIAAREATKKHLKVQLKPN